MSFETYDGFKKPRRTVKRVFLHCSAHDGKKTDNVATMDRWHKERGWSGVGYHFFIRFDGTIEHGRDLEFSPAAQRGHNWGSIAICCHGGQNSKDKAFTIAQFDSLRRLCADIDKAYKGKVTFHGHREVSAKACPVYDYKAVLKLTNRGFLGTGLVTEEKLEVSGSKTIKAAKSNKDAGGAIIGVSTIGATPTILDTLKSWTDKTSEWRSVIDAVSETVTWALSYWWLAGLVAAGMIYYNNRQIIRARIKDELKLGRLTDASNADDAIEGPTF